MFTTLPSVTRRHAGALALALCAAVVAACGGGGDAPTPAAAGAERATAYAAGPISGFGSVIVNGVRFDDSAAVVTDDDDRARSRELLKLGMMVEVDGAALDAARANGKALRIRFGSEIVGPVDSVASDKTSFVVLGQTVNVKDTTVFDSTLVGGMEAVVAGGVVEVHAQYDAVSGAYTATRVESATGATTYKLRGLVANLVATDTTKTFTLGGQVIDYSKVAAADLPNNLADGLRVRVRLETDKNTLGQWVATSVRTGVRKVEDRPEGHVRGAITVWTSAEAFEIDGLKVDATNAAFPDGKAGVVLGAVVEVEGAIVDGVLVARKVELDGRHAMERHAFELHGAISGLDATAKTFQLRGVKVDYSRVMMWKNGSVAKLADGKLVEVKGQPSADRTELVATMIEFED